MRLHPPVLTGDFSVSDLLREAAERSIDIGHFAETAPNLDTPTMSGTIIAEEVQPGLLMSGFDLTYLADCRLDVEVDRSILCAILLDGHGEPLEVGGYAPIVPVTGRAEIVGFGERRTCARPWYAGQRARVFGVTLMPSFFDRYGGVVEGDSLAALYRFMEPGVQSETLPWSQKIADLAGASLDEPYGGTLRTLFRESQALRFTIEIASMLEHEGRVIGRIGRRPYDRACQAREILDHALVKPPKVLDLARDLGVNVATLQASFKAAFGTTIFGYVRHRRLEMGRILILDHGLGVAEAGYRVGFASAAAFTAAYRRHFGHPPSASATASRKRSPGE